MPELAEREEQSEVGGTDREKFMAQARKRFADAAADEKDIRDQASLDLQFVMGKQWDERIKSERITKGRPALTFNRCHTFVQQVSNEARQNKPQIKFVAADNQNKDTAEVKEGLARHIQYCSDAQVAYETAVEYSAGGSFGYFGFTTEYCDDEDDGPEAWDMEVKVRTFYDPFAVYGVLIPSCFGMEPQYAFVVEEVPIEEYKRQYDTEDIDGVSWENAAKMSDGWIGTETVRVAEYWYIEYERKEIKRTNPRTKQKETRVINKPKVKFCKLDGFRVIPDTETDWPGYCIPIVPVLGKQMILDGKPNLFSVVRFQRDPQQLINYYKTRIAETLGTAPIQPWVVVEGQLQNHEREWMEQNTTMRPWLTVNAVDVNGKPAPMPNRLVTEAPIQALSVAAGQEIDDMKATAGIYDASLGNKSNETSGIALQRRQQQSNVTNMHFLDNLERAFKKGGLIIADLLPKIYDTERTVHILGPDEAPKIAKINVPYEDNGRIYHHKIGGDGASDDYPIVTMGRAFSTKRMESFDMMTQVLQTSPNLLPMIGDIFFSNSDLAGSDMLAERFKKMLPPNLQDADKGDPAQQAQMLQGQLQQTQQQLQAMHAYAQKIEEEQKGKVIENQAKVEIERMRGEIERMKIEAQITIAEINTKAQNERERLKLEMDLNAKLHVAAHEAGMQAVDQAHQAGMAQMGHEQALEQQDQAGAQQAALAEQQAQNQAASPAQG